MLLEHTQKYSKQKNSDPVKITIQYVKLFRLFYIIINNRIHKEFKNSNSITSYLTVICILISYSLFAYMPTQLIDYQRKDLAKVGVAKVIYKYENKLNPKRNDTLSIRQYNRKGFLTALDSFAPGIDSLYHLLFSQYITYSREKNLTFVRIEGKSKYDNNYRTTIQYFDQFGRLNQELSIVNNDTMDSRYTYDLEGNCIKQTYQFGNKTTMVGIYKYEYDNYKRILKEEYYRDSLPFYVTRKKYNKNGQLVEIKREDGFIEQFEYNAHGKKIRHEFICRFDETSPERSSGERFLYRYNNREQLTQIESQDFKCYPSEKIIWASLEDLAYLHSGLLKSQCSLAGCYQFSYFKKSKK